MRFEKTVRHRGSLAAIAMFGCLGVAEAQVSAAPPARVTAPAVRPVVPAVPSNPAQSLLPDLENRDISVLIQSSEETTLSSQMAGKVRRVAQGIGDNVARGAVLLEFDCTEQQAQLQSAEAEYNGARETHLTKLRLQALGAAGELEVTVAASAADKARSQVTFRESQLAYCKVLAPFSGRVAKMRVKNAESVAVGQPLVEMLNPDSLKAQLFVPAAWIRWIRPGTVFTVKTPDDGRSYRARVSKLNTRIEGVSQALELEARFEGSTQWLLPGMIGTALFDQRSRKQ
jgi:membrane fusion protein (multidrug efflux system)